MGTLRGDALTLGTVFRDATPYLGRWRDQVNNLAAIWDGPIHVIAVEGDSTDGTYDALKASPPNTAEFTLLHVEHGGPKYGSEDEPQRWKQLGLACNGVLSHASLNPTTFVYIESDLVWAPSTIRALISNLVEVPAISPMSFILNHPNLFYDSWGHVKDGRMFDMRHPYHPGVGTEIVEIDSAGSAFAVRAEYVDQIGFSAKDCIKGIGRTLRKAGGALYLDPRLSVYHP